MRKSHLFHPLQIFLYIFVKLQTQKLSLPKKKLFIQESSTCIWAFFLLILLDYGQLLLVEESWDHFFTVNMACLAVNNVYTALVK